MGAAGFNEGGGEVHAPPDSCHGLAAGRQAGRQAGRPAGRQGGGWACTCGQVGGHAGRQAGRWVGRRQAGAWAGGQQAGRIRADPSAACAPLPRPSHVTLLSTPQPARHLLEQACVPGLGP